MKHGPIAALAAVLMVLTGCMTVNQKVLPQGTVLIPPKTPAVVEVKYGQYLSTSNGAVTVDCETSPYYAVSNLTNQLMNRWVRHGLISDYGRAEELTTPPRYTLTVSGSQNDQSSTLVSLLHGLTMQLAPDSTKTTYNVIFQFEDHLTHRQYTVRAKSAYVLWEELFLFPMVPVYQSGANSAVDDIADYLYEELRKQGAFAGR
jgi:hypothetical protein